MSYLFRSLGQLSMLSYVFMVAISSIFIHQKDQQIAPMLSAFYTISFCVIIYSLFASNLRNKLSQIRISLFEITMLNVTTAICWIFTFVSLKYISPDLYLFTYMFAMPIASSFIYSEQLWRAVIYLAGLILLASTYHQHMLVQGCLLAFFGGASGTVYSIYAKQISTRFSTLEILSIRFYLTVFITFAASFYLNSFKAMSGHFYLGFIELSLISIIIPLALFQVGIKHLSITRAFSFLPLAPLMCYGIHFYMSGGAPQPLQLFAVLFLSLAMLWRHK